MKLILALTLTCGFAQGQSASLSGSYGFLVNAYLSNSSPTDSSGLALLGVMNFDGAGNVAGTSTLVLGAAIATGTNAVSRTGTFTGIYSTNSDGTGTININTDSGTAITFAAVMTDGGQGLQLVATACSCGNAGIGIPLLATAQSLTGSLPMSLFLGGATGSIPLSLAGVTNGGATVFTAAGASGSGTVPCSDGSTGTWAATVPTLTVATVPVAVSSGAQGSGFGDFILSISYSSCGNNNPQVQSLIGSVSASPGPGSAQSLVLQGPGALLSGFARAAAAGASLSGSYGYKFSSSPQAAATFGVMQFDGAGNATASLTFVGTAGNGSSSQPAPQSGTGTGTYSINPDGTGTLNFGGNQMFSFVITDGGSQLLVVNTAARNNPAVTFGTARMQ